ncbi:hypothetical protein DPMN_157658 [Dreissena polymorpha]|uniref:Uncharacterized protein n=1 Tax=Dreissena polymorpha TaxID=45954 RepID=A0A9D4EKR8_DREPO|nr:hypothetical protein DPMN_157658 [Dreissena polymorpha]
MPVGQFWDHTLSTRKSPAFLEQDSHVYGYFQAIHGPWVVSCYQDLAKQITVALKHEERRCQYLSTQAKIMATVHDEVASMPEGRLI